MKELISNYINRQRENILKDIARLVSIDSVRSEPLKNKPFGEKPYLALNEAINICSEHSLSTRNIDNYVAVASINTNETKLGILAHTDVVEGGEGWNGDPFKMEIKDGKIFGRGVADDKGPAVAAIYALQCAKELCPNMKYNVNLILGSGEETGSEDIAYYLKKEKMPPYVFSPDGDYPVINIEKGRFAPYFEKKLKKTDCKKRIISFKGGKTPNVVPRTSNAVITGFSLNDVSKIAEVFTEKTHCKFEIAEENGNINIKVTGKNAHAAQPHTGINSQTALISMISSMNFDESDSFNTIKLFSELFPHSETDGSSAGIKMRDEKAGSLTLNFGVLTLTEDFIKGNIDIRYPCKGKGEEIKKVIEEKLSKENLNITGYSLSEVHIVDENSPFIKELLSVYESYTNNRGECLAIGGGTYVHDIDSGVAFGCAMPGVDNIMHGPNEFSYIDDLLLSAKMFAQIVIDICA